VKLRENKAIDNSASHRPSRTKLDVGSHFSPGQLTGSGKLDRMVLLFPFSPGSVEISGEKGNKTLFTLANLLSLLLIRPVARWPSRSF
jgi:hypothetical protein